MLRIRPEKIMQTIRMERHQSQSFVARELGISKQQYSMIENGKEIVSLPDWMLFCKLFNLDYNSIFDSEIRPRPRVANAYAEIHLDERVVLSGHPMAKSNEDWHSRPSSS